MATKMSRRAVMRGIGAMSVGSIAALSAACGATPTPEVKVVTQIVAATPQIVEKEKVVTQIVAGTPQIVKETVIVEKQVAVTATTQPVTLTIWHHWGGTREPLLKTALDDFSARNPGVTVEPTLIPWDNKEQTILTAVGAGEGPDVLMLNASEMPPYALNKTILSIDDLVAQAGISADEVYAADWTMAQFEGKTWGLPQTVGGAANLLFFNKQHFEEVGLDPAAPPVTWADLRQVTKSLLVKQGDKIQRLGLLVGATGWTWLNFLAENEAIWLSEDGRKVQMDNASAVEALQFIVDLTDMQGGAEQVAGFVSAGGEADPFYSGRTAMTYQGVWNYYLLQTNAPKLQYGSALAPNNKGKWHEGDYGPHLWTLLATGKHVPQAWALAMWMSRGNGGCQFLAAQLRPSPWKACNEQSALAKLAPYWPVVEAALNSARPEPRTPLFNQFLSIWDEMLDKATHHQSDAAATITWATDAMTKANDEFWQKHS